MKCCLFWLLFCEETVKVHLSNHIIFSPPCKTKLISSDSIALPCLFSIFTQLSIQPSFPTFIIYYTIFRGFLLSLFLLFKNKKEKRTRFFTHLFMLSWRWWVASVLVHENSVLCGSLSFVIITCKFLLFRIISFSFLGFFTPFLTIFWFLQNSKQGKSFYSITSSSGLSLGFLLLSLLGLKGDASLVFFYIIWVVVVWCHEGLILALHFSSNFTFLLLLLPSVELSLL